MLGADCRWLGKLNIFGQQLTQVSETTENETEDKGGLPPFLGPSKCIFFFFLSSPCKTLSGQEARLKQEVPEPIACFLGSYIYHYNYMKNEKLFRNAILLVVGRKRVQRRFFHLILKMPC